MIVQIVINAALQSEKVFKAYHRRKIPQRAGVLRRGSERDSSRIHQRDLSTVLEEQNQIMILGLRMDLFLEVFQITPRQPNPLSRSDVEKSWVFFVVKHDVLVAFGPSADLPLRLVDDGIHELTLPL